MGLNWNRVSDSLSCMNLNLAVGAHTKRLILKSIASNFDIFNYVGPLLNRARLFLHNLQCRTDLGWDTTLSKAELNEWRNISKQFNSSGTVNVSRTFGSRRSKYTLVAFTDSSKQIYGTVLYLKNNRNERLSFVLARNRLVSKQLATKTIPVLELLGVVLGVENFVGCL